MSAARPLSPPGGGHGPGADPNPHEYEVVVVTGATAGVGRAVARRFAEDGCRVALLARGSDGLRAAAEDVRRRGGTPLPITVDVVDAAAVEAAATRVERELGPISVWVNTAFASVFAPFEDITPEEFDRATRATYLGYVNGTRAALRRMRPAGGGALVQVGSALAYRGIPLQSAYCGAKHAIQGFTESLRCELLHEGSGVHVTMVQLPAVNTPQFDWVLSRLPRRPQPVPPIYQPEVAAEAVLHASRHPERREYWVGGSTVLTLLANAVAPGLLDRYLARTGFRSQQTAQAHDPDRPANLWDPVDEEPGQARGAHGSFDDRAHGRSVQLWCSRHHGTLAGLGLLGALAVSGLARRRHRDAGGRGATAGAGRVRRGSGDRTVNCRRAAGGR